MQNETEIVDSMVSIHLIMVRCVRVSCQHTIIKLTTLPRADRQLVTCETLRRSHRSTVWKTSVSRTPNFLQASWKAAIFSISLNWPGPVLMRGQMPGAILLANLFTVTMNTIYKHVGIKPTTKIQFNLNPLSNSTPFSWILYAHLSQSR